MHELYISFLVIRTDRFIDVSLDDRLTFEENIIHLKEAGCDLISEHSRLFEPQSRKMLKKDVPVVQFSLTPHTLIWVF